MNGYILNKNKQDSKSGESCEIHNEDTCNHLPLLGNRIFLGFFSNCHGAMKDAKVKYPNMASEIDGCYYCCPECHHE